jgi:hypothetical protein
MLMAELHSMPRQRRSERGAELIELFGLADRREQKGRDLSKGLRQRLMHCMALVSDPEILGKRIAPSAAPSRDGEGRVRPRALGPQALKSVRLRRAWGAEKPPRPPGLLTCIKVIRSVRE